MTTKILKSKWYIYRVNGNQRIVLPELGTFKTESRAWESMFRPAPKEKQTGGGIMMERKPEFENHYTVKGARVIRCPHTFCTVEEAGAQ